MEQSVEAWQYRCRYPGSEAESLWEWGSPRTVMGDNAHLPLTDPRVAVEIEWRPLTADYHAAGEWTAAVPHEFGVATAEFAVMVLEARDFREDNIVRAIGVVRGHPACFELMMPKEQIAPGTSFLIEGSAFSVGIGVILREAGELSSANDAFRIANTGPSKGALLQTEGPALPSLLPFRGSFFARAGRLPAEEVQLLIEQCQKQ